MFFPGHNLYLQILNMAAQAEPKLKILHSPHRHLTFEHNRTIQTESGFWDDNLASQPFTDFEGPAGEAVEPFTAEIFGRTLNRLVSHWLKQMHRPMHRYPFALAVLVN